LSASLMTNVAGSITALPLAPRSVRSVRRRA
jgi:hypothetical protein